MMADLNDLSAFVAVVRAGGFRDGARASGVSASGLSEAVRRLETQTGRAAAQPHHAQRRAHRGRRAPARTAVAGARRDRGGAGRGERLPRPAGRHAQAQCARDAPRAWSCPRSWRPSSRPIPTSGSRSSSRTASSTCWRRAATPAIRYDERLEQDMIAVPIGPRVQRFATAAAPGLSRCARPAGASARPARARLSARPVRQRRDARPGSSNATERWCASTPPDRSWCRLGAAVDLAVERGGRGARRHPSLRGLAAPVPGQRRPGAGAGAVVAELLGPVPLLSRPPPPARAAARLRRLHQSLEHDAADQGRPGRARLLARWPVGAVDARSTAPTSAPIRGRVQTRPAPPAHNDG